jgi:hypothetical protein
MKYTKPTSSKFLYVKIMLRANYQGITHIYSVPEFLLETQQKYIRRLEEEIAS